jgi:Tol biopolymer transport system component
MLSQPSLRFVPVLALFAFAAGCDRRDALVAPSALGALAPQSVDGKIAFTSGRDGNNEIYVMNADGSSVTRLTDDPAVDQDPAWSPDGSRIAFTSTRNGNYDIFVMNADGTGVTQLTTTTTNRGSTRPAWCGNRIAFESDRYIAMFPDVYVMNDDGTDVTRLTLSNAAFDQQPAWSPTCDRIAFTQDPGGNVEIYVMNADGTGATRLTNSPGADEGPAWSPDGTRIAFTSRRDADQPPVPLEIREIYVMNADGSGATRLTHTDVRAWNVNPAWSPDGTQIAFQSDREGANAIYVMNADGTNLTRLTSDSAGDAQPAWFGVSGPPPNQPPVATFTSSCSGLTCSFTSTSSDPDGSIIAYSWTFGDGGTSTPHDPSHTYGSGGTYAVTLTVTDNQGATGSASETVTVSPPSLAGRIAFTSNRDGNNEIYVMNADGSGVTRLTDNPAIDQDPAWSPDGTRLTFVSTRDGNYEIYVMNADGSGVTRLTTHAARDLHPTWCGTRIAFDSDRYLQAMPDIYVMNDDGTGVTQLTISSTFDQYPAWSPSCEQIAYTADPDGSAWIRLMNADGSGAHDLVVGPGKNRYPAWSPDGTRIAFTSDRDTQGGTADEVYVMNSDGTQQTRLTVRTDYHRDLLPAWSSDGTQIAFQASSISSPGTYVMNADGSGLTQLADGVFFNRPAWFGPGAPPPP